MTTPELEAIRGHSSAASFATGPVMADPFISPLGLTICIMSAKRPSMQVATCPYRRSTHHTSVVLKVEENTVCSPPWLALADNDGGHDLLPQLGLSLLDGRHDHVSRTTGRQTVKTRTDTLDGDDVQVAGTGVVAAVHDGAAVIPLACVPHTQILHDRVRSSREGRERSRAGWTYTGRPRVILSLLPEEPRLRSLAFADYRCVCRRNIPALGGHFVCCMEGLVVWD
jgi:hypothetical protein